MTLEHFNPGRAEAPNSDLNSKLHDCCYPNFPGERNGDKGTGAKDKQPSDADFAIKQVKDSKETREQLMDQKIKDRFGADVLDHMKDWDWLIENRKKLEDGFKKASNQDAWDMAWRMRELSMVDGKPLIYLTKEDGPTKGNLIPKRYDIHLRRGSLRSDDCIGQTYR